MELAAIKSKVAAAVAHEQRTGALRQSLTQTMRAVGRYDQNTIEQLVTMVRAYVEQVPTALEAVQTAGKEANVAEELKPILEHAERAFVIPGAIPDEAGLMGLTDNAYLLFQLFARIGQDLSPEDLQVHQAVRSLLGEPLASQLDAVVQQVVASPDVQQALQRLAAGGTPMATAGANPSQPTAGPSMAGGAADRAGALRPSVVAVRTAPVAGAQAQASATEADFPGALDPSFGRAGHVVTNLQKGKARAMAIQADKKIVVAGESLSDQGATSITIARYNPNGGLDATFGGSGCVRLDWDGKDEKKQNSSAAAVVVQPDGKVVVFGGAAQGNSNPRYVPEMFNPSTETWTSLAAARVPRVYHQVSMLLPDGRVWTAGSTPTRSNWEQRTEFFRPGYYSATRPTISGAPTVGDYGESITIPTPNASSITRATLVKLPDTTHHYDANMRHLTLQKQSHTSSSVRVNAPLNNRLAPPGYYYLHIINSSGIPSQARIVRIR